MEKKNTLSADPLNCNMDDYRLIKGLQAEVKENILTVIWDGEEDDELRLCLKIQDQKPVVHELAIRPRNAQWKVLGQNLLPEFSVTCGKRRMSQQQLGPLRNLGCEITPELIEEEKWNTFWDAPLNVPGISSINHGMPRQESEISRGSAAYKTTECRVETNGARLEISFPGLSLGIFSGSLRFTVYRGTNLIRQEAIARTEEKSVAYKYAGGLSGFAIDEDKRVVWNDTGGHWQKYEFGGSPNDGPVALRARNRLAIIEAGEGSIAFFPPSHKFFFAREIEINLGYVWYRKDDENSFSVGVRHGDREEMYRPYGVSEELREKRIKQSTRFSEGHFALYNAPPGTWQRMGLYYFLSSGPASEAHRSVMSFTHNDSYKSIPGYYTMVSHYHVHFGEMLTDAGSLDVQATWIPGFRALGVNIALMSDFHGDGHSKDTGALRLKDMETYFAGCRRHSDRDFLILPGEEPNVHLGGHYTVFFPKPVYWTRLQDEDQSFIEEDPTYGQVYHTGNAAEVLEMLRREKALMWQTHPRTKGSTGYPDAVRDTEHFNSDRFLGATFKSLPVDQSQKRLGEALSLKTLDNMNNWTDAKCLVAEVDTYTKYPDDELYGESIVNYVKLPHLPRFDEDWSPIIDALRAGSFFVTTGEVLIREFSVEGDGDNRKVVADVEWTFPLEFVEIVWGDGETTDREEISATDHPPFGRHRFIIPFKASGKKWVRFAAWDSAGNGAFSQPVHLKSQ